MTDKELIKLARFNNYPEEHMDLLVGWGRRVLMAQRQFDLELMADNIRTAVMKEREACAKLCAEDNVQAMDFTGGTFVGGYFSKKIIDRGQA
jgi:hypothetical protein